jgi:D-tyrosyl-tRNA(Tyr) deacylase
MRAIIQRVKNAQVTVGGFDKLTAGGEIAGRIGKGLLVYLGVGREDDESDAAFIADKIVNIRVFADSNDKMNLNVKDTAGGVLIVSNFTLFGDCRKGRRPGFDLAAEPGCAERLYEKVVELVQAEGLKVEKGVFAAYMDVTASNDGPVNFLIDSKKLF